MVSGQLCSGKDVLADYLSQKLNCNCVAFGDAMKRVFMDFFEVDLEFIEQWKRKDEIPKGHLTTVRQSLQKIGDEFRQIKPSVWIDLIFRRNESLVISDGRYMSEVKAVKDRGGVSILLWRPGFENEINHPSESQIKSYIDWCVKYAMEGEIHPAWGAAKDAFEEPIPKPADLFDLFIINDGSINDLYTKVDKIIIPYVEKKYG